MNMRLSLLFVALAASGCAGLDAKQPTDPSALKEVQESTNAETAKSDTNTPPEKAIAPVAGKEKPADQALPAAEKRRGPSVSNHESGGVGKRPRSRDAKDGPGHAVRATPGARGSGCPAASGSLCASGVDTSIPRRGWTEERMPDSGV